METTFEMGLGDAPPPPLHPDRKYTRNMGLFEAKSASSNLVADTSNVL